MTHPPCLHCHGPVTKRAREDTARYAERQFCSTACAHAGLRGKGKKRVNAGRPKNAPAEADDDATWAERRERVARLPMLAFLDPERVADFERRMKERGL